MHATTVANQQFPSAAIHRLFSFDVDAGGSDQGLRTVDGLVSVSRNAWAEPFDAFGNFAA